MELKDLLLGEEKKNITSEDILINELKIKKRKNILTLIFGIIIWIMLCILEVFLYISGLDNIIGIIIFGIFILMMLMFDLANYLINKK